MRSAVAAWSLLLAVTLVLAPATGAAGATATQTDDPTTTIRIALAESGDARVTVTVRFALDSENETRAFDRLAEEFRAGESDVLSADPFERAASLASEVTGRQMAIEGVSREAGRSNGTGRLALSFEWTGFAQVTADRMKLGDVFRTPSGTWLSRLDRDQELIIAFPDNYSVSSSSRGLDNGTFHIEGPEEFDPGEPWATLERDDSTRSATVVTSETPTPTTGVTPALGIGVTLVVLAALALLIRRRRGEDRGGETPIDESPSDPDGGAAAEELLSDEERVLRLLSANDGRMKQAAIVEETDWSNAKVSQLLSEMADRDEVEKLRIGRENLISLPEEAPDDAE